MWSGSPNYESIVRFSSELARRLGIASELRRCKRNSEQFELVGPYDGDWVDIVQHRGFVRLQAGTEPSGQLLAWANFDRVPPGAPMAFHNVGVEFDTGLIKSALPLVESMIFDTFSPDAPNQREAAVNGLRQLPDDIREAQRRLN
jgi:hypothetical protein